MIIIRLTQNKVAIIDDIDSKKVSKYKWYAAKRGKTWYAMTSTRVNGISKKQLLHRFIMRPDIGVTVDHIDCDGLNCIRRNLRFATKGQQSMNQRIRIDNRSGYRGVCYTRDSSYKPWRAAIQFFKKSILIGYFKTSVEAAKAYNKASIKYHGEFGYRNLIQS